MIKRFYILLLAIVASVGMMNAKVTWNSSNISDLYVSGTYQSYSKEGVTLSANSDQINASWYDYGDESMDGISFNVHTTGGFTFSNTLGKNFTKIEMTLTGPAGWDFANLGSGWSFSWDYLNDKPATVTWTGNASTVDLMKDESDFNGERVKSIVFYFEGDSEEPGGGSTAPAWVQDGDEWDETTKTLTVNSNPGTGAYASQSEIEHLIISDAVTSIGQAAFGGCSNISSVTCGNNIQTIGVGAFTMCGFTSIELPASVTTIGNSAFYQCSNLISVTIGNNVTALEIMLLMLADLL